jgi:LysM repeat protein
MWWTSARGQTFSPPSPERFSPAFWAQNVRYSCKYPHLRYEINRWEWKNSTAVSAFFEALLQSDRRKLRIVHIGDSHVQADTYTGAVRNRMQELFGAGGRGMIFPYAAAKTHAAYDYHTYAAGPWDYARNIHAVHKYPIGLSGATIRTLKPGASVKIVFNAAYRDPGCRKLGLFSSSGVKSFDLKVVWSGGDTLLTPEPPTGTTVVELPISPTTLEIYAKTRRAEQRYLDLYGMWLETPDDTGVLYHSVGINGAGLSHLLQSELLETHLKTLRPDLVVIDLGANDYFTFGIQENYESNLRAVVEKAKRAAPCVLISCSQDIYRRYHVNLAECKRAAEIARKVAFEMDCSFYDWYGVAGGEKSMLKWQAHGLAQNDRVHLTVKGYQYKGEMFVCGLLNSLWAYKTGETELPVPTFDALAPPAPVFVAAPPSGASVKYVVRPGDNLGSIALRHGVTVAQLKQWNGLTSDFIRAGATLVIHGQKHAVAPTASSPPAGDGIHVVQAGESLWSIARKYGTSVEKLATDNGIINHKIHPGQKLKILR